MKLKIPLYRICFNCKKEVFYWYKSTYKRAVLKNNICQGCSQTGSIFTEERRENMRNAKLGTTRPQEVKDKISRGLIGHERYKNPGPNVGRKFSKKWRENISKALIEKGIYPPFSPNYNPNAIPIIEQYGKEYGYNFQHAENGGEIRFGRFSVDGCDLDQKIIIEIDEKHHFNADGSYKKRDIDRQKYLENLGYNVIRIRI